MATFDKALRSRYTATVTVSNARVTQNEASASEKSGTKELHSKTNKAMNKQKGMKQSSPPDERPRIPRLVIQNKGGFKARFVETVKSKLPSKKQNNHVKSDVSKAKNKANSKKSTNSNKVAVMVSSTDSLPAATNSHIAKHYVLHISDLPENVTKEQLEDHFRKTGGVKNVRIPKDKGADVGKGFAFIEFKDRISRGIALRLHHTTMAGKRISVNFPELSNNHTKPASAQNNGSV